MKKVLVGCGIGCLVLVVLAVGFGYWAVQAGRRFMEATEAIQKEYQAANTANPFVEPETDAVTEEQVARWLAVRQSLLTHSSTWVNDLEKNKKRALKAMTTAIEGAGQIMRAHAAALQEHKMSATEYQWITQRAITALESGDAAADADLAPLAAMLQEMKADVRRKRGNKSGEVNFHSDVDLSVPMTSEEIAATLAVLKPHSATLQTNKDVFTTDFMLLPMIEGFGHHQGSGWSDAQSFETPAAETPPAEAMPADAAPAAEAPAAAPAQ